MIYVYAPSMATIVFIAKQKLWNEICIITHNPSIIKFCHKINISYITIHSNNDLSLKGLKQYKKEMQIFAKQFAEEEFIFCFYSFDIFGLFLMEKLKKRNTVYFYNLDHFYNKQLILTGLFNINFRKTLFNQIIYIYTLRTYLSIFKISKQRFFLGRPISKLEQEFNKYNETTNSSIFIANQLKVIEKFKINNNIDILFIDQGKSSYTTSDNLVKEILNIAEKSNLNFTFKPHPTFSPSNNLLLTKNLLPKELPIEFLTGQIRIVIGIASTSFKAFSNNEIKISLINLVSWKDNSEKEKYKHLLNEDIHMIEYPKKLKNIINQSLLYK